ncbi:GTPase-activating protein skywalker isoform X1 [Pieris napi]|uniref:GTPase-activating protein skywalker isoform X1 n=1 Tax=Pieris napi TaxID=78633 RepID=UPI001FB8741F|nr:GTPase-activating protein skywalker isoform X1 [Pieris napi]XP_047507328.1 GTPase-activating protein skywalker isoform X1 [Pieris napi]XP_047507329.1 GTPase-activating protein skywalker isoform X1 [Pieris napi]XP_047507330.1 GTPase-activating protein skywalker isoform X1 [Pieris napi]
MPSVMLSAVLEEEADLYEAFPPHVDPSGITILTDSPPGKKAPLKTYEEIQPLIQQSRKRDLKLIIRENSWPINSPLRASLWPALCRQHQHGKSMLDGFYWDMVTQVFGTVELPDKPIMLPPFVEATHCLGYHLTRKGRAVADRVVSVLGYACPDITYSPSLYPITAALLHFMPEEECYHCMASLVASKEKMFITQTKLLNEVTWKTVMQIAKKHAKSAAQHLLRLSGAIGPERIYADWQWWILAALPFPHLVRVLDCFFHEGLKVFYRVALAILILFHKHSTNQNSEWYAEATKNGVDHAIDKFCRNMPASPTKLLRTAFSIRALSSQYISRVFIKTEMTLKSKQVITGNRLVRSRSSDNLPTSQSQVNIQMMSHTLTIREKMSEETCKQMSPRSSHLALWFPFPNAVFSDQQQHSSDLRQKLFTLWSWLPVRITMYQPVLLYTTEEHGCSLTTFYVRVEHHEPTLLMIKTCNNEVFGAYCSTRWFERNQKDERGNRQAYFGTGETFLFSLYPERAKYPWVGCSAGDGKEDQRVAHGSELFMAADSKMITIGGGDGQAIWMDENIRYGKTDRCSTFNNPPLCPSGDFEIRVLEVYGFAGA